MTERYVNIDKVLAFVDRTTAYGVPLRVATARAERRFGVQRTAIREFVSARARALR